MKLVWTDLETTGLHFFDNEILEIYIEEADLATPFDTKPLYHRVLNFTEMDAVILKVENPFVFDMHTKNGLLAECLTSTTTISQVQAELLDLIPEIADRNEKPTIAGSTVHFDLNFLRAHTPKAAERLHYRVFDVSAVKLFARSLGMDKQPRAEAHRAAADVRESIDHCKGVIDWMLSRGFTFPVIGG